MIVRGQVMWYITQQVLAQVGFRWLGWAPWLSAGSRWPSGAMWGSFQAVLAVVFFAWVPE
jgi:hypothetical protein